MASGEVSSEDILCYGFNQDATCLAVGLRRGYRIYTCRPFTQCFAMTDGGIGRAEMLFSSSLVALVGSGDRPAFSPRRLRLWNTKKDNAICEVNFHTAVLAVKLNRKRVAVCLASALHVFDIADMKCLRTLETAPNPDGVMALSPNELNCHLAFPDGGRKSTGGSGGEVILYDALDLKVLNKVMACRSRVVAVSFSRDGKLLATASEQGTVIRIFTVPAAVKTYTLRRGSTSCGIYSMSFNAAATRLAVSSSNKTIHIFDVSTGAGSRRSARTNATSPQLLGSPSSSSSPRKVTEPTECRREPEGSGNLGERSSGRRRTSDSGKGKHDGGSGGKTGIASSLRSVVSFLPNGVTKRVQDYVESNRSFASVRLRGSAGRSICALIPSGSTEAWGGAVLDKDGVQHPPEEGETLLVVTSEGILYSYAVDTVNGGECRLEQASSLLTDPSGSQELGSELYGSERRPPEVLAGEG